jgi:hypothetical protein
MDLYGWVSLFLFKIEHRPRGWDKEGNIEASRQYDDDDDNDTGFVCSSFLYLLCMRLYTWLFLYMT